MVLKENDIDFEGLMLRLKRWMSEWRFEERNVCVYVCMCLLRIVYVYICMYVYVVCVTWYAVYLGMCLV